MTVIDDYTPLPAPTGPCARCIGTVFRTFIAQRRSLLNVATRILAASARPRTCCTTRFSSSARTPAPKPCAARRYISRVVRNLALDSYRRQHWRNGYSSAMPEQDAPLDTNSPDSIAMAQEQATCLRDAMRRLPSRTRDAVVQYYYEDQTQKRIAERLGISATMVNSHPSGCAPPSAHMNIAR